MHSNLVNQHLTADVSQLLVAAAKLKSFCARLASLSTALPAYLYVRPLQAEIVFTRPAMGRLAQLFGPEGWRREAAGVNYFDWTKKMEEGVTLRISECEETVEPQSEVSPAMFRVVTEENL